MLPGFYIDCVYITLYNVYFFKDRVSYLQKAYKYCLCKFKRWWDDSFFRNFD